MTQQRLRHQWRYTRDTVRDTAYDLRKPESRTRMVALQTGKSTVAAIIAWYIASELFGNQAAWLAPMTAVLMVHSTVYRSISEGVRRVVAVAVGAMLSAAVGTILGLSALSLLVVVPLSLLAARLPWIRAQGEYITVTAVVLLTFGMFSDASFLASYVVDTAVGAVVGTLVNAFVFPPGYQRSARAAVSDLASHEARTLRDVADGTQEGWTYDRAEMWRRRADRLIREAESAQSILSWSQESQRWNPWPKKEPRDHARRYQPAITVLWHVALEIQDVARGLRDGARHRSESDMLSAAPPLQDDLEPLLDAVADVVETFGDDPQLRAGRLSEHVRQALHQVQQRHSDMASRMSQVSLADPERFAATGAVLQGVDRMLGYLHDLDRQPDDPAGARGR